MSRLLAMALVLLFGLPLAAPLFGPDAATSLPQCCRRNGRHHCAASMTADSAARTVSAIAPKCPRWPKSVATQWPQNAAAPGMAGWRIPLFSHPRSAPQIEARYRVAFARSRQKRGPPAPLL